MPAFIFLIVIAVLALGVPLFYPLKLPPPISFERPQDKTDQDGRS